MSLTKIKSDKIILENEIFSGYIYLEDGKIVSVETENKPADFEYDYTGLFVSAGFIDMHTHGAGGHPFLNTTKKDVIEGCNLHLENGTTTILPTISASPFTDMKDAVIAIAEAIKSGECKANVLGAHLEGPYLSKEQCGAQCPTFITEPIKNDYTDLIENYGEYIARWSYAPEKDENGEFCKYLTEHGIIASAGHTNAKYEDMKTAIDNGCNLITHLYSCTSTITREYGFRSLGVIESAFLRDELFVEIIADGKHLPIDLVKMIIKIKGTDKTALITDSLEIACTDIKEGVMGGTEFIVEDGVCKLKDRSAFAGSVATSNRLVKFISKECGFSLIEAVKMITKVPAEILKINKGKLAKGFDADIIVFDDEISIKDVFVMGKKVKQVVLWIL